MSANIERLRYYDGEYLRGFDFDAEQQYHLAMRRRLNLALHLDGIVDGLDLVFPDPNNPADQPAHVAPGMAIDGFGRELVLFAPAVIEDLLATSRVDPGKACSVWLVYDRRPATPPSLGYRTCGPGDQSTRWVEAARVVLSNDLPRGPNSAIPSPAPDKVLFPGSPPGVTARLSDDPASFPWAVYLGAFSKDNSGQIQAYNNTTTRRYVGLRGQRIMPAAEPLPPSPAPPAVAAASTPAPIPPPITVGANLLVERNLVVAPDDFEIKNKTATKQPPDDPTRTRDATGALKTGALKLGGDLFLSGDFYALIAGDWLNLKDYINSLVPDVQVSQQDVPLTPTDGTDPFSLPVTIKVKTRLPVVRAASIVVAISKIEWQSKDLADKWQSKVSTTAPVSLSAVPDPTGTTNTGQDYQFKINVQVTPVSPPVSSPSTPPLLFVKSLTLSYIAVFTP
jgi:hypothetical protein